RSGHRGKGTDDGVSAERGGAAPAPDAGFDDRQPRGGVSRLAHEPLVQLGAGGHHHPARDAAVHAPDPGQRPHRTAPVAAADDLPDADVWNEALMKRRRGVALIAGLWLVVAIATVA